MITLPTNFQTFAAKAESTPATIVKLGDSILEDIQGSQGDWENNSSESQVDYATVPGDVILGAASVPNIEQLSGAATNDDDHIYSAGDNGTYFVYNEFWQSFKQATGASKKLNVISIYVDVDADTSANLSCVLYDAKSGTPLSTVVTSVETTGIKYADFDFSAQDITLENNVIYWIKSYVLTFNEPSVLDTVHIGYDAAKPYSGGQLDRVGIENPATSAENIADARFKVSMTGDYYLTPGNITTQIIDLGETPAVNGEWKFNDTTPSVYGTTAVIYTCFGSTDNFVASNVSIGAKVDGDPIESGDWYRYYKITSTLSATNQNETPAVHDVGVSFVTYITFSDRNIFGYEPALDGISSLSTKIDDFALATVSQITCNLGLTQSISNYLYSNFPRNKPARVLIGFDDAEFLESDFFEIYSGAIDDWKITTGHYVNVTIRDISKSWKVDIPKETTVGDGNQTSGTYQALNISADHPVDVMLEILQNHLDIRDAVIDFGSFEAVKTSLSGWVVTRDLTGEQIKADELLNELRVLTTTYFLPDATGKIKLKEYDSTEAAIETLTDDDFIKPLLWESNIGALKNKAFLEFDWNTGTEVYDHVYIAVNATSISNNDETITYSLEDKWTLNAQVAQIQALKTFILGRYAAPPAKLSGVVDRKKLYLEVGDMVNITTTQAPSTDLSGITATKFQIIEKNFNQNKNTINFVFLEV